MLPFNYSTFSNKLKKEEATMFERTKSGLYLLKQLFVQLFIGRDESHPSLDMDLEAMQGMNEKERTRYRAFLLKKRIKAHQKDSPLLPPPPKGISRIKWAQHHRELLRKRIEEYEENM